MKRLVFASIAAVMVFATPVQASDFSGVVTRVSDGDTVWIRPDGERRRPIKLRLQGIDAPEGCQAWGEQSTAALSARVLGQRVEVHSRFSDDYGRLLGELRLARDGADIGAWMVGQGHAWSYRFRHHPGPYATQEAQARAARRGLFNDPNAELPGQFRKRHGPCEQVGPGFGQGPKLISSASLFCTGELPWPTSCCATSKTTSKKSCACEPRATSDR